MIGTPPAMCSFCEHYCPLFPSSAFSWLVSSPIANDGPFMIPANNSARTSFMSKSPRFSIWELETELARFWSPIYVGLLK